MKSLSTFRIAIRKKFKITISHDLHFGSTKILCNHSSFTQQNFLTVCRCNVHISNYMCNILLTVRPKLLPDHETWQAKSSEAQGSDAE